MLFNPSPFYRTPCGKRDGRTSCRSNLGPRTQQQKVPCAFGLQNIFWRHAFGSFDHNSWSAQGAVRSAAHRFVHTFLRKLLVCPQIRPLFYPQTAGGSTDSSTNCHFCPQAAFLTANHDVCRHTRPQMSAVLSTKSRFCPQICPQIVFFRLQGRKPICPCMAPFVRRFVRLNIHDNIRKSVCRASPERPQEGLQSRSDQTRCVKTTKVLFWEGSPDGVSAALSADVSACFCNYVREIQFLCVQLSIVVHECVRRLPSLSTNVSAGCCFCPRMRPQIAASVHKCVFELPLHAASVRKCACKLLSLSANASSNYCFCSQMRLQIIRCLHICP